MSYPLGTGSKSNDSQWDLNSRIPQRQQSRSFQIGSGILFTSMGIHAGSTGEQAKRPSPSPFLQEFWRLLSWLLSVCFLITLLLHVLTVYLEHWWGLTHLQRLGATKNKYSSLDNHKGLKRTSRTGPGWLIRWTSYKETHVSKLGELALLS